MNGTQLSNDIKQNDIKKAAPADLEWMLDQLKEFSRFYGTKISLFGDIDHAAQTVLNMIENHVCFVSWRGEIRTGFIAGYVCPHPYNPEIQLLTESFWWVDPEYRMSRAGLMLLDKFTEWGEDNCDWVIFTLEHHSPVKDDCLLRRGYRLSERSYLKEVE